MSRGEVSRARKSLDLTLDYMLPCSSQPVRSIDRRCVRVAELAPKAVRTRYVQASQARQNIRQRQTLDVMGVCQAGITTREKREALTHRGVKGK